MIPWLAGVLFTVSFIVADLALVHEPLMRWFYALLLCCFLVLYRIFKGPTAPDRAAAMDILGILVIGFCGIFALVSGRGLAGTRGLCSNAERYPIARSGIFCPQASGVNTRG